MRQLIHLLVRDRLWSGLSIYIYIYRVLPLLILLLFWLWPISVQPFSGGWGPNSQANRAWGGLLNPFVRVLLCEFQIVLL